MLRFTSLLALSLTLVACGSSPTAAGVQEPDAVVAPPEEALPPVQAGSYQLRLSVTCERREHIATGVLTLRPIAGEGSAELDGADSVLLWGQADLDLEQLSKCLGGSIGGSSEPIHPSLLVEVLRWDGEPHHPVLLVSTEARPKGKARRDGVGIAMWVERVEEGHIGGVWSRWEIMGREEGRWEADLVAPL